MVLLDNNEFLTQLTLMYQRARLAGSVRITLKRYDGRTKPIPRGDNPPKEPEEYSCLFKAALRSKKLSTVVTAAQLADFQTAFSSTLRANMDGLKKTKKTKAKRKKTAQ